MEKISEARKKYCPNFSCENGQTTHQDLCCTYDEIIAICLKIANKKLANIEDIDTNIYYTQK
jgi:hypothetical protein